jgi:hypothetical protein
MRTGPTAANQTTINYYGTGTTANSTTNTGTGAGASSAPSATGDYNGDGEGSCGAPGQPACQVEIEGLDEGAAFGGPALEENDTAGGMLAEFYARIGAAPLLSAFSGLSSAIPTGGVCPTATFDFFGTPLVMDAQCTLLADLADVLGLLCLIMYGFTAARILLSA